MNPKATQTILTANEIRMHFGDQVILDNAFLSIHEGDRIGLVGRNGSGKSTFLKILAGIEMADSGQVFTRRDLIMGYVPQEFELDPETTVYDTIRHGADRIIGLLTRYDSLPPESAERGHLHELITQYDAWTLDHQIEMLMMALGTPPGDRSMATLSGGERRRVAICRAIIGKPELLILDEPTNHLDTDTIEWFEDFLLYFKGSCLLVTHDRYFLDRVATRIVELSQGTFFTHQGNYSSYLEGKAKRIAQAQAEEVKRQGFLKRELEWIRRGPQARTTKSKARIKQFYDVAAQEAPEQDLNVDVLIPEAPRLGKDILKIRDLSFSIGEKRLIDTLSLELQKGQRWGIVGRNGLGKTTLLKLIMGQLKPVTGEINVGGSVDFNYIDQQRLLLDSAKTLLEEISDDKNEMVRFGQQMIPTRGYLKRFLFTDDRVNTRVDRLSGGERSRLMLAKILKDGGNFLLLDEPTNDLDLQTLRVLEEALTAFSGCVMVVSHDRYFLNRVCTGIIGFEGDGKVWVSEGDYDFYQQKRRAREDAEKFKSNAPKTRIEPKKVPEKNKIKRLSYFEKKELATIEENILAAEVEVAQLETLFSRPDFYDKHGHELSELNAQLQTAKQKVSQLYDRWAELEQINAGEN